METARCRAFLAAADTGSFSKAAELLSYTPSGVSQLVSALEADIGYPLLRRTNKGVTVTTEGEMLIPAIREFLNGEDNIYQLAADTKGLLIGSVTIASYSSIATHWLPEVISRFQADYPQIKITMLEGCRPEVNGWLDEKAADIAFTSYREPFPYDWIPLSEDKMMALLPKDHPCAELDSFPFELCRNEKLILPGFGHDDDVIPLFEEFGIEPDIRFSTVESFSALQMVEKGLGISIMNELITRNWPCEVVKIPISPPRSISFGMALASLKRSSPAVRRFVNYAESIIKNI